MEFAIIFAVVVFALVMIYVFKGSKVPPIPLGEPCVHDWEKIDRTLMASPYARLAGGERYQQKDWMYKEKLVVILKCKKCGELDKTITENP